MYPMCIACVFFALHIQKPPNLPHWTPSKLASLITFKLLLHYLVAHYVLNGHRRSQKLGNSNIPVQRNFNGLVAGSLHFGRTASFSIFHLTFLIFKLSLVDWIARKERNFVDSLELICRVLLVNYARPSPDSLGNSLSCWSFGKTHNFQKRAFCSIAKPWRSNQIKQFLDMLKSPLFWCFRLIETFY